jgi:hypothetical protein
MRRDSFKAEVHMVAKSAMVPVGQNTLGPNVELKVAHKKPFQVHRGITVVRVLKDGEEVLRPMS